MRGRFVVVLVGLVVAVAACSSGSSVASSKHRPEIIVIMDPYATSAQTAAVRQAIRSSDDVERYSFTSHAAAYREFRKLDKDSDLAAVTRPSDLPESFSLTIDDGARWRPLAARLDRMAGVQSVGNPDFSRRSTCRDLRRRFPKPPAWMKQQCNDAMDSL